MTSPSAKAARDLPDEIVTEAMLNAARDWSAKKYGKPIGNDAARGCFEAMNAARPQPAGVSEGDVARALMLERYGVEAADLLDDLEVPAWQEALREARAVLALLRAPAQGETVFEALFDWLNLNYAEEDPTIGQAFNRRARPLVAAVVDFMEREEIFAPPHPGNATPDPGNEARSGAVEQAIRKAALIARDACLVPPDGGSPTEEERLVCEEAERRILAMLARSLPGSEVE